MLEHGFLPEDITIITPYQAQHRLQVSCFARTKKLKPDWHVENVTAGNLDSYPGKENKIIILDLANTSNIGFLSNSGRLCVAFSRFQCGIYILCNKAFYQPNPP